MLQRKAVPVSLAAPTLDDRNLDTAGKAVMVDRQFEFRVTRTNIDDNPEMLTYTTAGNMLPIVDCYSNLFQCPFPILRTLPMKVSTHTSSKTS